jgi:hypothetical protein
MTNDEVRAQMTRIADARMARRAADQAAAPASTSADAANVGGLVAGARVLDVRTGREGTVDHVGPPDRVGRALLWVRFADGSVVSRGAADLQWRPTPPTGRP